MATKAEMAAELALLRQKCAEQHPKPSSQKSKTGSDSGHEPDLSDDLDGWLASHGIKTDDTARLLKRLTKELDGVAHDKPLMTAGVAFAMGFALGRMSK